MAGNLTIEQCGNVFAPTSRQASSNYGIGSDGRIAMYVEEANRSWCSSNADNDNRAITIEVANDGGDPDWHVSDKAMASLINLCIDICQRNGIKKLNYTGDKSGNLTMHKWFAATGCPGAYLSSKFPYIAEQVNKRLSDSTESKGEKKMSTTKGIDISRYQGNPDFAKVKKDVDFVIMQAGYGRYTNQVDSSFERNYAECKKHGIKCSVYWFSYASSVEDAKREAKTCLEVIKGKQFEYPIYFDIEGSALSGDVSGKCKAFCDVIEKAGYFAGIYISRSPAQSYLTKDVASRYALWLAEYAPSCNYKGDYGMWQYSSSGRVSGISGDVDMNYCYVDYPTIIKNAGLNGFTKPATTTTNATIPTTTAELKTLDSAGVKKGDKGYQALALKSLLKLAVDRKIVEGKMDDTSGIGNGCIKVINALLKKWGYKQTGIAGTNFINKIYKELK